MTLILARKRYGFMLYVQMLPELTSVFLQSEFEETILEDLLLMGIKGDQVTHTSDYFQHLYDACITMLKNGKAYADDTEQEKVRSLSVFHLQNLLAQHTSAIDA